MLLDEPSAGLNREEREDLARFILRIKHELNMTMIWIEHDMQMIADLADRIHVLDYGRTIAEGVPEAVLSDPNVLCAYLGSDAATASASDEHVRYGSFATDAFSAIPANVRYAPKATKSGKCSERRSVPEAT